MHTHHHPKGLHFGQLIPLLDKAFDGKISDTYSSYRAFQGHSLDESSYLMRFDDGLTREQRD